MKGNNILFFSVKFFSYDVKMKMKMEELGAKVDIFDERPIKSAFNRALLKVVPILFTPITKRYYTRLIKKLKFNIYNYVFIYGPDMITPSIMKKLRANFPNAVLIAYCADSIYKKRRYERIIRYFDKFFTYDRKDYDFYSIKYDNLYFRPLFYLDKYILDINGIETQTHTYDWSFIGTIHSDRQKIINYFIDYSKIHNLKYFNYPYLQSKFIFWFYKFTKSSFRNKKITDFKYKKIDSEEIFTILKNSKFILDMQHPKNTGLTMRTIESIAMQCKIITTNEDIINYDFYNSDNIEIIPRENIIIQKNFFDKPLSIISKKILKRYSLDCWIKDIFLEKEE